MPSPATAARPRCIAGAGVGGIQNTQISTGAGKFLAQADMGKFDEFRPRKVNYKKPIGGKAITLYNFFVTLPGEYEAWAKQAASYFKDSYGLSTNFALSAARLYIALWGYGLNPRITSGFRDPKKQAAMREAWDRGDRQGLRVKPADPKNSLHCKTAGFFASPAAEAIDMPCTDDRLGAQIAQQLGLRAGYAFNVPDPGHYDGAAL